MESLYHDIDLENCFPRLTLQLAKMFKLPTCKQLNDYVTKREHFLEKHSLDKRGVLEMLNKSYEKPQIKFFRDIHDFIYNKFVPQFKENPLFHELWQVTKRTKGNNRDGSFYSKILQYYENAILMKMEEYLSKNGYDEKSFVFCFDGIQVPRQDGKEMTKDFLAGMERHILKMTGFKMNVVEKPMTVDQTWLNSLRIEPLSIGGEEEDDEDESSKLFRMCLFEDQILDQLAKRAIIDRTHDSVAKFLFFLWEKEFYFHDEQWWYFSNHCWKADSGRHFQYRILSELVPLLEEKTKWKSPKRDEALCDLLKSLKRHVETKAFYRNVMETAAIYFSEKDFYTFQRKLESNMHLLCFANGVYDLNKREFRDGNPSDYCLLQIRYNYVRYDPNCKKTRKLEKMLQNIMPNVKKRIYLVKALASSLGCHVQDKFNILHGCGANGKSFLTGLMCEALDTYAESWNTSILVHDFSGESANPELADGQYKRFIEIQESKRNKALNMENVKKLTGYDYIRARRLYQNGTKFVIIAQIFLSVNDLPKIVETDSGTWRRMNVIMFESRFVTDAEAVDEGAGIFLADEDAKKQRSSYAPQFMSILIEYYKQFIDEGNETPDEIKEDTLKFRKENDIYNEFYNECCILDSNARIHVEELFKECTLWAAKQNDRNVKVDRKDMLKWFQAMAKEDDSWIEYEHSLRIRKEVNGKTMSKVSTGFKGIKINKYQVEA